MSLVGKSFPIMHAEPPGSAYQSIDSLIEKLQSGVEVLHLSGHEKLTVTQFCDHIACRHSIVGLGACNSVLTIETCPQVDGNACLVFLNLFLML